MTDQPLGTQNGSRLPALVGLCPEPSHAADFYMPLDPDESRCCPYDCPHQLAVYVPEAEVERLRSALERIAALGSFGERTNARQIAQDALEGDTTHA